MSRPYMPIIKTWQAEWIALDHLDEKTRESVFPLFELTRTRSSQRFPNGDIQKNLNHIEEYLGNTKSFILDLTNNISYINPQIEELYISDNGYKNWKSFLLVQKKRFKNIVPTIISNDNDVISEEDNYKRLMAQIQWMDQNFDSFAYRLPLDSGNYLQEDLNNFERYGIDLKKIVFILDNGFFRYWNESQNRILEARIHVTSENLSILNKVHTRAVYVASENYPQNPSDVLDPAVASSMEYHTGELILGARKLFSELKEYPGIGYSDYATIFPEPTSQEGGRGWIPRIDIPTENCIVFGRKRRERQGISYEPTYRDIAKNIRNTSQYQSVSQKYPDCWGIENIDNSSKTPTGCSPSHWISTRMNIHITIQNHICTLEPSN